MRECKHFYYHSSLHDRESYGKIRIHLNLLPELPSGSVSTAQSCGQKSDKRLRAVARAVYSARRQRSAILPPEIGEAAWNILLEMFITGLPISTKHACLASDAPATTALRWINILESNFCIERFDDSKDRRCTFVELTDYGKELVRTALAAEAREYAQIPGQSLQSEDGQK